MLNSISICFGSQNGIESVVSGVCSQNSIDLFTVGNILLCVLSQWN